MKKVKYYVNACNKILPSRLIEAKKLIDGYSKRYNKVFVAGSFLFSKRFNDVDIFVIWKKGFDQREDGNKQITFLAKNRLFEPVYQSIALISVANFKIPKKVKMKKPSLNELMLWYRGAIIWGMQKEKKQIELRKLIFNYHLFCKNKLINGKELKEISKKIKLDDLDMMMKELCRKLFSKKYLDVEVGSYIKMLKDSVKKVKLSHYFRRLKKTYEEIIK